MSTNSLDRQIYVYKRFRVRKADGASTTVSLEPALVVTACKVLGSLAAVGQVVRQAATTWEANANGAKNRSAHVSRTLKTVISAQKAGAVPAESTVGSPEGSVDAPALAASAA